VSLLTRKQVLNLVGYCRVSTDNQKEEGTILIQERALEEFCKANAHQLVAVYKDEGVSGTVENRPGLASLFTFLECSRGIHGVLIYKLDRLARDLYMQEHLLRELDKRGLALYSTKESDLNSTDPMRVAFRQFVGVVSELEKSFITMRLSAGRQKKASEGRYAGGGVPLGYRVTQDKDLMVDEADADTVMLIFKLRRKRWNLLQIATHLNKHGLPTARGGRWYASTIKYILENPRYKGKALYSGVAAKRGDWAIR
jgi:site-specific DNA recombinase